MECAQCQQPACKRCPCRAVRYCSLKCQRIDWPRHKDDCRRMRAEQTVVLPPRPWYNHSAPELAQHCYEFALRARSMREHKVEMPDAEAVAYRLVEDGTGAGLVEMEAAVTAAREMFVPRQQSDLDDLPSQSGDAFGDRALAVQRMLCEAAHALLTDDLRRHAGDWVAYLFDGRVLLGKTPTMVRPPKATPEQLEAIRRSAVAEEEK
jgi:hypothetical protein